MSESETSIVTDSFIEDQSSTSDKDHEISTNVQSQRDFEISCMAELRVFYTYFLASFGQECILVNWFHESGTNIDSETQDGKTALSLAVDNNDVTTAGTLRLCGAKDQVFSTHLKESCLKSDNFCTELIYQSSYFGSKPDFVNTVCQLLHVTVDLLNEQGDTALTHALRKDNVRSVKTLITAGARVDKNVLQLCDSIGSSKCIVPILKARPDLVAIEFCRCILFLIMSIVYLQSIYVYVS